MSKRKNSEPKDQSQWVFMLEESALDNEANKDCANGEANHPSLCKLLHPRSGQGAMFLFCHQDRDVHEVIQFKETHRSWLINETVQQDGSLFMTTPVDPVFLVLPYLINAAKDGKFMTLEQVIHDEDYPECRRLCSCQGLEHLSKVADTRGEDDFNAYRYNQDRTLTWLRRKVERVAEKLKTQNVGVSGGATAPMFVKSLKSDSNQKDEYLRFAHGIISDYLPLELSNDLREFMGIKAVVHEKPEVEQPAPKKAKISGDVQPSEDYSKQNGKDENANKKGDKLSAAQKSLSKVDKSGMKSIASFFAKPKK